MKSRYLPVFAVLPLLASSHTHAQSTWTGATNGEWGVATNWDTNPVFPNAADAIANINTALTVSVSDQGGIYPYTFGTLATSSASGSVVIGTTAVTTDILKAEVATGTPVINVANSATNIFYYANLQGTQGFNKTGAGKFTFRFNGADQTYTGNITISGGILGINQNSSLGDDGNDITIASGTRLLAEPGSGTGTITLPDTRTITLGGVQSQIGASPAAVNLVINGEITESAGGNGLVKTDGGKVTLAGFLTYTGETRIAGGTLGLSGLASLPTSQNLRFNGATGTLDLGGTPQTVRTIVMDNVAGNKTITGGGSLTVNGDANLTLTSNNGVTYDFSGIDSFTFDKDTRNLNFQTTNVATVTSINDFNLAKSGIFGGTNTITAAAVQVGGGNSDGNNGNTARLHLGTLNTINADTVKIGAFNAAGVVDFQAGLDTPSLKLRATDGASAVTTLTVGETSSGTRHGDGTLNLTGGSLDAVVTSFLLGRHVSGTNTINNTASVTMPGGTLDVGTMLMAEKTGGGTPTLTATFTQEGGDVIIDTLTMGAGNGTEAARLLPTYRLWGGTLAVTTIQSGGGTFAITSSRSLILRDGILINQSGADLAISGITITVAGNTTTVVDSTPGQKVTLASTATYSARINSSAVTSGALNVDGDLDLSAQPVFNVFDDATTAAALPPGTKLVLIDYTDGSLAGTFAALPEGATINVTKGAVTNTFVIKYADNGGTAVTLTVPSGFGSWIEGTFAGGTVPEGLRGPNEDPDNDGVSNLIEYALAGFDPTVPNGAAGTQSGLFVSFAKRQPLATDLTYAIETSEDLGDDDTWAPVTPDTNNSTTIGYTLQNPGDNFARLRVVRLAP